MIRTTALLLSVGLSCAAETPPANQAKKVPLASIQAAHAGTETAVIAQQGNSKVYTRPYIHPLRSPDGKNVLTQFSPGHHRHQTGLYWGQTRINGRDFFHNYRQDYWKHIENRQGKDSMEFHSELLDGKDTPMLRDRQVWHYQAGKAHYILDLEWTGTAIQDVTIGKYAYGGLFLRMPWKRGTKAACLNSEGHRNQQGEGKSARWVDLAMQIEGMKEMAHIAMIDHPGNPGYPTLWRIDGQFGVGPALARRGDIKIPRDKSLTYRYRLVVYEGDDFRTPLVEQAMKGFDAR
ncbi:MAG: PmoA family protein [Roseibacillus sp.]